MNDRGWIVTFFVFQFGTNVTAEYLKKKKKKKKKKERERERERERKRESEHFFIVERKVPPKQLHRVMKDRAKRAIEH